MQLSFRSQKIAKLGGIKGVAYLEGRFNQGLTIFGRNVRGHNYLEGGKVLFGEYLDLYRYIIYIY